MSPPFAPESLQKIIIESLTDPDHPAYGQVATVDPSGKPQVRTVHLRYLTDLEVFAFGTNQRSPKWAQLQQSQCLAGCYFDEYRQVQFRWESAVELVVPKGNGQLLAKRIWSLMRPHIRADYWADCKNMSPDVARIDECCPTLGVVVCKPQLWDIYEVMPDDPSQARRSLHRLEKQQWISRRVSLLHGKDLGPF